MSVQKADHRLPRIGIVSQSQTDVVQETISFTATCYGENKSTTASDVRRRVLTG